jgi:TfoX/Sxy family transcriptional regulator of competence genes
MASTREYKNFIVEQLSTLENVSYRYMMGEYILNYNNVIFGGIYDDRLLVKMTENNKKYEMEEAIPYPKGKPMYLVSDVDNRMLLREIVLDTYFSLTKKE